MMLLFQPLHAALPTPYKEANFKKKLVSAHQLGNENYKLIPVPKLF